MKTLIACTAALIALSGCVAVPYAAEPAGYYYGPPPAATVHFGYTYRGGGPGYRHGHGHGYGRRHRH